MKKLSLTLLTGLLFLSPNVVLSETMNDLVKRNGLYYKKFSNVPFSGVTTGQTQGTLKNGKWDGSYVSYYDNGQLMNEGNFKNGFEDGLWISYHENGKLTSKGNFWEGGQEGAWVWYWDNGQLNFKGNFGDSGREGVWVAYWKNGTVWRESTGTYKNGKKISD